MFAGKSTELECRIHFHQIEGKETIILKWDKDLRENEKHDEFSTHRKNIYSCVRVKKLMDFVRNKVFSKVSVIGVDDAQFFVDDLVEFCELMVNKYKKTIYFSGLDLDANREPYMNVMCLVAKSEYVTKLYAVCDECKKHAFFSYKKKQEKNRKQEKKVIRVDVGGEKKYGVLCRVCYNKLHYC